MHNRRPRRRSACCSASSRRARRLKWRSATPSTRPPTSPTRWTAPCKRCQQRALQYAPRAEAGSSRTQTVYHCRARRAARVSRRGAAQGQRVHHGGVQGHQGCLARCAPRCVSHAVQGLAMAATAIGRVDTAQHKMEGILAILQKQLDKLQKVGVAHTSVRPATHTSARCACSCLTTTRRSCDATKTRAPIDNQ